MLSRLWIRSAGLVSLSWCFAACSSESTSSNAEGGSGGRSATGGVGGSAGKVSECAPGPGYAETVEPREIDSVSATLVDLDDQPAADELVEVCGIDLCTAPQQSAADGSVSVAPGVAFRKPAFKFGDGKSSAAFAWLLPAKRAVELGTVRVARLPALDSGVTLSPGDTASSGGLSLILPASTRVRLDTLTFAEPDEQRLRATRVPIELAPPVVTPDLGLELLYAATPTDTEFCPPVKLTVENSESWAAGTEVEVLLHGVSIQEEFAPYGGWAKVSDARVSDDGERIETTSPGLSILGVLGFRRK